MSQVHWPEKPKNTTGPASALVAGMGCALMAGLLLLGVMIGFAGAAVLAPSLLGFSSTQAALNARAAELDGTSAAQQIAAGSLEETRIANALIGTQAALIAQATQAGLLNEADLLMQTATQGARNIDATRTAQADLSAAQMTQVALDYAATQSALQQNATQVELNYQATQAALNRSATAIHQGNLNSAQSAALPATVPATGTPTMTPSPMASRTPIPTHLPFDATSTGTPTPATLTERFDDGLPAGWLLSAPADWNRAQANRNGAWLLKNATLAGDYAVEFRFTPALTDRAEYGLLFNVSTSADSYVISLTASGLEVTEISLYRWTIANLAGGDLGLNVRRLIDTRKVEGLLVGDTVVRLTLIGDQLTVALNEEEALVYRLNAAPAAGAYGVLFPQGATLNSITTIR